jgi:PAS domain S-box-containing protein
MRKDGSTFLGEVRGSQLPNGNFQGILIDITKRKQMEEDLLHSEQRYKILAAATFDGISITENGKILDVNDRLLNMLGYERHELIGNHIKDFISPEDISQAMKNINSGLVVENFEHSIRRRDGSLVYVQSHSNTMVHDNRNIRLTAIVDMTERKRAADALTESMRLLEEKEQAKTRFLAAAGHDLRQPLSAANLFIDALKFTGLNSE